MERESVINQLRIEHELINHIAGSLLKALDWTTDEKGSSRKLSTLRFVADAFRRHLERLMAIHEYDGYRSYVTQSDTRLIPAVERLKQEHNQLREKLNRAMSQLERLSSQDHTALEHASDSLRAVLRAYDNHSQEETRLIQEALLRDVGGSG